jgi:hypothetical protein
VDEATISGTVNPQGKKEAEKASKRAKAKK